MKLNEIFDTIRRHRQHFSGITFRFHNDGSNAISGTQLADIAPLWTDLRAAQIYNARGLNADEAKQMVSTLIFKHLNRRKTQSKTFANERERFLSFVADTAAHKRLLRIAVWHESSSWTGIAIIVIKDDNDTE